MAAPWHNGIKATGASGCLSAGMTNQLAVGGVENEAAVEQKVLFPLLTLPAYLALPLMR